MANIVLKNVNKIYPNNVHAVYDFNLEIKDKEFIVFVGPSGCGKSTTLRMIAGLEEISTGEFLIDGKLTNFVPPKDRNISMVFQNYALYPHMTVFKNMSYGLKIKKDYFPEYEADKRIETLYKEVQNAKRHINLIVKKMIKDSDNSTLKNEYMDNFNIVKNNLEEIMKIRKPIVGLDVKRLARLEKEIESNTKELEYVKSLIAKDEEYDKNHQERLKVLEEKINSLKASNSNEKEIAKAEKEYEAEKQLDMDVELMEMFKNDVKSIETIIKEKQKEYDEVSKGNTPILKYRHYYEYEIDAEVFHAASILDLELYLHRFPAALSGGQRQRVALGRAIVRRPKVFLMDEPLSNLDAKLRVQTRGEILKLHKRVGATTIYVTHDQTEAMTLADRIVIMKDGLVQQIDKPLVCFEDPANMFVAGFIGSPAMNFIHGTFEDGYFISNDKAIKIKLSESDAKKLAKINDEIVLGVRPEHIKVSKAKENIVTLNVTGTEILGTESIVYTLLGENALAVKTDAVVDPTKKEINVSFDKNKLYFFDNKTTMRIR